MRQNELSIYLSYLLRHHPEAIGLEMDKYGWVDVTDYCVADEGM